MLRQFSHVATDVVTRVHEAAEDASAARHTDAARITTTLNPTNLASDPGTAARFSITTEDPARQQISAPPEPGPVTRIVTGLLTAIGFGAAANDTSPAAPVSGPTLLGALGLIRRELEHFFLNKTPDVAATPTSLTVKPGRDTTFTVPASDADGDRLTYTVTDAPDHGDLTLVSSTANTYTYRYTADTADEGVPTGGTVDDQFTLTASDAASGFHFHGLASLFNPQGAHTDTVTVTVDITTANVAPEVRSLPSVGDPNGATGAVSGFVGVVDPDGDHLTYTLAPGGGPENGTVTFDPLTGTYTYTPTTAARITAGLDTPLTFARTSFAAAAPTTPQDTFTVNVSDGQSSTSATVTVPISPANSSWECPSPSATIRKPSQSAPTAPESTSQTHPATRPMRRFR